MCLWSSTDLKVGRLSTGTECGTVHSKMGHFAPTAAQWTALSIPTLPPADLFAFYGT